MLEMITPLLITYNEEPNINRTLQRLTWATRIVVIDSFSTDQTLDILRSYPQVEIFQRSFDSFASQCNFGLSKIHTEWVLSLDADYLLSEDLIFELKTLQGSLDVNGYFTRFKYCVFGKPLRGTLLPPRQILFRREKGFYQNDGHAHKVVVEGQSGLLSGYVYHDDRKPVSRWFTAETNYSVVEMQKLIETPFDQKSFADKVRSTKIAAPFLIFIYCLVVKGGVLDGWHGWYYALQRMLAEILLAINLIHSEFGDKVKK